MPNKAAEKNPILRLTLVLTGFIPQTESTSSLLSKAPQVDSLKLLMPEINREP